MSNQPKTSDGPEETLLLVEGPGDVDVVSALLRAYGLEGRVRIQDGQGYQKLRKELPYVLEGTILKQVGIVADADTDVKARWASLRDRLAECQCQPPKALPKDGAIFPGTPGLTVGVWLMPDNSMTGALEAFLRQLVPESDENWEFAEKCVAEIPNKIKHSETWAAKAQIHTWLAWQEQPGKPPEAVFQSPRYLDPSAGVAQAFVGWVRRLFELE